MEVFLFGYTLIFLLGGLGYFTIWRLTSKTKDISEGYARDFDLMKADLAESKEIIQKWQQKFSDLETEVKLKSMDSARIIEWLDKERTLRDAQSGEIVKALKITERESRIIELGQQLRLITNRK